MKISYPLLEKACREFPIDSENVVKLETVEDDGIVFDIWNVNGTHSMCYWSDDRYTMFAPYDVIYDLCHEFESHIGDISWSEEYATYTADSLSERLRTIGYSRSEPAKPVDDGFEFRYDSPSGMTKMIIGVVNDRRWLVELIRTADTEDHRDEVLDRMYDHFHRFDRPMGL